MVDTNEFDAGDPTQTPGPDPVNPDANDNGEPDLDEPTQGINAV